MKYMIVGTNHEYSPVELRERLYFTRSQLLHGLSVLSQNGSISEAVIVSTCNRTEVHAAVSEYEAGKEAILKLLSELKNVDRELFRSLLYVHYGKKAVAHLFKVWAGLDSLITGEIQIQNQMRNAFAIAQETARKGELMSGLSRAADEVTSRVRRETAVSEGKVSVGSLAVQAIRNRAGSLRDKNMLIIGVGKVTELVLKYLAEEKSSVTFVANRTYEKAARLAGRIGAEAVRFDRLNRVLEKADIVITATASPHYILREHYFGQVTRDLLLFDLAVPRDVSPEVGKLGKIKLYTMENMKATIQHNMLKRKKEALRAGDIIDEEVHELCERSTESLPEPVLSR